jgi:hypothetical protein
MAPDTQPDLLSGASRPAAGEPSAMARARTRQLAVTIIAPVRPRRLAQLRRLLETMGEDSAGNETLPFGSLRGVHFARLVLLERARDLDGNAIPAQLLYMCDVDEPLADHLGELLDLAPGLDRVFGACEGYPTRTTATSGTRACWLADHLVETQAYYVIELPPFVQTRGGGYFFLPGVRALRYLASVAEVSS